MPGNVSTTDLKRLQWHCRRGMREMDLLLGGWLDEHYSRASPELQQAFSTILEELDQDILDWVMQRRPCPPQYAELVGELRHIRRPDSS